MAKRRPRTLNITLPEDESQAESQTETQAGQEAEDVASELGSGSFAIITRLNRATAQYAYLDRIPGNEVNQAMLAERYGGGSYKVQLRGPKAGKRNVILNTLSFEVDASIPPKTPPGLTFAPRIGHPMGENNGHGDGDMTMDKIMQAGVLKLLDGYGELIDRKGEGGGGNDMIQLLIASMQSQSQMMMAMMQSQSQQAAQAAQAQASTLTALISLMANNKPELAEQVALFKAMAPEKQSFKDMLESFQMLREISGEVAPEQGWPGVVREAIPALGAAIQGAVQHDRKAQPQPQPRRLPAGQLQGQPTTVESNPPQPTEPDGMWKMIAKTQLPFLLKQAAADKEPDLYAALLCDQVPDVYVGALRSVAESDTFVEDTLAAFPETHPYRDWFTKLLSEVRAIILDDGDDAVAEDDLNDEPDEINGGESQSSNPATGG